MLPTAALLAAVACLPVQDDHPHCALRRVMAVTAPEVFAELLARNGFDSLDAGRPADALVTFDASLRLSPDAPFVVWGRATTLAVLGRHNDAADAFARMLSFDPTDPRLWQLVAMGWADRGKLVEAETCFAHAASLANSEQDLFETLFWESGYWAGATPRQRWPKTLGRRTGMATATSVRLTTMSPERMVRAEVAVSRAITLDTDGEYNTRADAFRVRGVIRYHFGRASDAAADADQALSFSPADAQAHHLRALAAMRLQDTPTALAELKLADRYGHPAVAISETRCDVYTQAGEYAGAEEAAREWRRLDPKSVSAARRYGALLRVLGKDEDADRAIEQAAMLAEVPLPGEWTSHILDMTVYTGPQMTAMLCGRYLDRIPLTQFQRAFAYASRGEARRHMGMGEEGFDDFCTAVRLHPGFAPIRMVRATQAFHRKEYHIVLEDAEALIRMTPNDPAARKLLADTRAAIRMAADLAGRAPDYRPAGPVVGVPITVSAPRVWMAELGERKRCDVR